MSFGQKSDGTFDLTGTKATGAHINGGMSSVDNRLDLADVRFPCTVSLTVRVGNVVTECDALSANTALCHLLAPPFST